MFKFLRQPLLRCKEKGDYVLPLQKHMAESQDWQQYSYNLIISWFLIQFHLNANEVGPLN